MAYVISNTTNQNGTRPIPATSRPLDGGEEWLPPFRLFLEIVEAAIIIVALVCNIVVVYAFIGYKKLRTRVTNYFVISLAVSDILTTGLVTAFKLDSDVSDKWKHGEFMCNLYTTMYLLAVPSSVINLCAVTVDRYLVLRMPLRYNSLMPPRRAVLIIACLWIYAIIWACLPVMGWKENLPTIYNGNCYFVSTGEYNIIVNIINFLLPMIFMAVFWLLIYAIVQQHRKRVLKIERSLSLNTNDSSNSSNLNYNVEGTLMNSPAHGRNERRDKKKMRRNVQRSRYIGFIVVLFYFCWLPYVTLSMIGNLCMSCPAINLALVDAFLVLGFMNSALNPFLYPFHDKHFKEAFRDMWKKVRYKLFRKMFRNKNED